MQILVIQGGLGTPSRTAALAGGIARQLSGWGHAVETFDLRQHQLPWVDPDRWDADAPAGSAVERLIRLAERADAHVWATPVYHNSYSGALKCALDHLSARQLRDKPVALCGDGGRTGTEQPLDHLRAIARSFHAIACPAVIATRSADYTRQGDSYTVSNPEIVNRIRLLCTDVVRFGRMLAADVSPAAAS